MDPPKFTNPFAPHSHRPSTPSSLPAQDKNTARRPSTNSSQISPTTKLPPRRPRTQTPDQQTQTPSTFTLATPTHEPHPRHHDPGSALPPHLSSRSQNSAPNPFLMHPFPVDGFARAGLQGPGHAHAHGHFQGCGYGYGQGGQGVQQQQQQQQQWGQQQRVGAVPRFRAGAANPFLEGSGRRAVDGFGGRGRDG